MSKEIIRTLVPSGKYSTVAAFPPTVLAILEAKQGKPFKKISMKLTNDGLLIQLYVEEQTETVEQNTSLAANSAPTDA